MPGGIPDEAEHSVDGGAAPDPDELDPRDQAIVMAPSSELVLSVPTDQQERLSPEDLESMPARDVRRLAMRLGVRGWSMMPRPALEAALLSTAKRAGTVVEQQVLPDIAVAFFISELPHRTKKELHSLAGRIGIVSQGSLNKADLIAAITDAVLNTTVDLPEDLPRRVPSAADPVTLLVSLDPWDSEESASPDDREGNSEESTAEGAVGNRGEVEAWEADELPVPGEAPAEPQMPVSVVIASERQSLANLVQKRRSKRAMIVWSFVAVLLALALGRALGDSMGTSGTNLEASSLPVEVVVYRFRGSFPTVTPLLAVSTPWDLRWSLSGSNLPTMRITVRSAEGTETWSREETESGSGSRRFGPGSYTIEILSDGDWSIWLVSLAGA